MSILHVARTTSNIAGWIRDAASSINLLITGKQDRSDNLDSLSGLGLTGNANKSVTVKATEDGFELTTVTGGSGIADGDYGDIVVSGSGTAVNFDSSVVTAFAKTFLDDADAASVRTTIGAQASGSYLTASNNLSDLSNAGTARTNLGLGTIATQSAASVSITGGSITGITDLAVADGGTGASTASAARTNLGLVIGTDVQAYNTNLAGLAGLTLSQGDILYRDGSGLQRLAAGTSGQFLKTNGTGANPAWASGTTTMIESQTLSAVSTFSLEAFAGGSYKRLIIDIDGEFSVDGANLNGTMKLNGSYKTGANYRRAFAARSSSGSTNTNNSAGATSFLITDTGATWGVGNASGEGMMVTITIINPFNTTRQKGGTVIGRWIAPSGQQVGITDCNFSYDGTDFASALQGIKFDTSSGTFTGVATVYGLQ